MRPDASQPAGNVLDPSDDLLHLFVDADQVGDIQNAIATGNAIARSL